MIEKKKFWRIIMSHIKFDYSKVLDKFVAPHEVEYMQSQVTAADELIRKGTGPGLHACYNGRYNGMRHCEVERIP